MVDGAISIPEDTFGKLNASKNAVRVPADFGGGRLAFIEGIHQLHCLVSLVKRSWLKLLSLLISV